jgi:hypothetical protein
MNNNDIIDFYIDFNAHKLNILETDYITSEIFYLIKLKLSNEIDQDSLIKSIYERLKIKYKEFDITRKFHKLI